ncbi:merozoite surface protein, putative [Perkinsus marinus ATCC 50983]|uniref:Merozoite surface protein, putative n=1 Tax=Perkinsus marinus (strain ATCC 50983 / TXsc) TaxID=423536 RepID=C5KWP7_PERM5|nr:merozoite surface protein, putative [Perkinsus marinus ATCC 50983]EER11122.1 merozoite surface protein, putative [Perkinsus marinus ATCC 50983]|eukprot:XP_002779327.1 merozoite surface protein, putative [Perkinsus marinus ATCC 50983]
MLGPCLQILALREGVRVGQWTHDETLELISNIHRELEEEPVVDLIGHRDSIREALEIVANAQTTGVVSRDIENLSDAEEELLEEGSRHLELPKVIVKYEKVLEEINQKCCEQLTTSSAKIKAVKAALMDVLPQCGQLSLHAGVVGTALELLFPGVSKQRASEIKRLATHAGLLRRERRAIFRRWRERRLEALHAAQKQYKAWAEGKVEEVAALEKRTRVLVKAQALRERLDEALALKQALEAGERIEARERAEAASVREAAKEAQKRQYTEALKKRVEEHGRGKEEIMKEKARQDVVEKLRDEELRRAKRKMLAARVAYREKMATIRAAEQECRKEACRAEAEQRKLRIQRAIQKFRVTVEADPERLSAIPSHKKTTGEHPLPREIFRRDGYGIDDLEKDPRYRLQAALFEAGLYMSESGHEVMLSMVPRNT